MQSSQFSVALDYWAIWKTHLDCQMTSEVSLIVLPLLGAVRMLQLAVCITIHVAVEWRWEEPLLAYTLAGAEIELFENIAEGL
jgi:hypothetical protein